jgi:hypothetical protein
MQEGIGQGWAQEQPAVAAVTPNDGEILELLQHPLRVTLEICHRDDRKECGHVYSLDDVEDHV